MIKKDYSYLADKSEKNSSWPDFNLGIIFGVAFATYSYWFLTSL